MKLYYIFFLCLFKFSQLYASELLENVGKNLYHFCYKNQIFLEDKNPEDFCQCFKHFLLSTQSQNTLISRMDSKKKKDRETLLYLYWQSALICKTHPNSSELAYEVIRDYCLFHIKSYKSVCTCASRIYQRKHFEDEIDAKKFLHDIQNGNQPFFKEYISEYIRYVYNCLDTEREQLFFKEPLK